ncbi:cytochrome P450, partial [Skermania pinensis]
MTSTPSLSMLPRPDISGRALSLGLRFVEHYPSPRRPLAPPPAGSGLRPVPGRPGLPYIGYAPMVYDMIPWTRKMFAEFGPVSWSRMFGSDAVYVLGPEAQEVVWLNRDKAFSNELGFDHFTGPFFRRGLLMLDFDEHLHHRRIMQQAFTRPRLLGYLDMLAPAIAEDLAGWQPSDRFRFYTNAKQMLL